MHLCTALRSCAVATLAAVTLVGCGQAPSTGTAAAGHDPSAQRLRIGMSFQELNNDYFVSMQQALKDAAATLGADVVVTDAGHNVGKQVSDVEDMVQQGIDILLINPTDSDGIQSAVETAARAGVVVVAIDANAAGPVDAFVGSRNVDAGRHSCDYLANALGGKGEVAILDGIPVVPILERVRGCREALAGHPGIRIVGVQNGRQDRATALSVTENMLAAYPNLAGIFSVNDVGSMGVLGAIQASGRDIKLTSVDGSPEAVQAIAQGSAFIETTAQFPRDQVRLGLATALAKKWGAQVPAQVPVDVKVVDRENAAAFRW